MYKRQTRRRRQPARLRPLPASVYWAVRRQSLIASAEKLGWACRKGSKGCESQLLVEIRVHSLPSKPTDGDITMGDKPEDPTDWAPGQPPPTLASRGYEYVPGPTGDRSDWVLRKIADGTPFAFESQQKYDAVGAAV